MSDTLERGRAPRIDAERMARRRRQPGSLNRMVTSNLGVPEECLDPAYHYHWVNDRRGRIQMITSQDDYDIVTLDELEANARAKRVEFTLNRDAFTQNGSQVSVPVERDGTRAILVKKPKDFYDHDYEEACAARQAMMEARVYNGGIVSDVSDGFGAAPGSETLSEENLYVPQGNTLGDTAPRRRGPIPRRVK